MRKQSLNPINETAYYCCGVRMQDAASKSSIINDQYAVRFMDEHGLKVFSQFKSLKNSNNTCVTRCRIIDDILRQELQVNKDLEIVLIGAGFDSRAFRIPGGVWYEIDEIPIIEAKEKILATKECPNQLSRIAADFSRQKLADIFPVLDANKKTIFVVEGVLMYLDEKTIDSVIATIQSNVKRHKIIADLMSVDFINAHMQDFLKTLHRFGGSFRFFPKNPQEYFIDRGYTLNSSISIIERSYEFHPSLMPKILIRMVKPHLFSGYRIACFDRTPEAVN
jgi:methyltransferase (TIGR00027 family)